MIMHTIKKAFRFIKEQPFGCVISSLFSLILIATAMAAICYVTYSLVAVSILKNTISDASGFRIQSDSVFLNLYTGKCEMKNVEIENPSVYDINNISGVRGISNEPLIYANKIEMIISPFSLIFEGKIKISSVTLDIKKISCMRINHNTYNLPEFIGGILKVVEPVEENETLFIKNFTLKIDEIGYKDLCNKRDIMHWDLKTSINLKLDNISDFDDFTNTIESEFKKVNAGFISKRTLKK